MKGVISDGVHGSFVIDGPFDIVKLFSPRALDLAQKKGTHDSAVVYDDDTCTGWFARGCMACLGEIKHKYTNKKPVSIYSSLWVKKPEDLEDAKALWSFVLDPERSPWRLALKGREIIEVDGRPIAYRLADMDAPMQVLANLCFTLRMPYAQDGFLRAFTMFKSAGFSEVDALYLAANVGVAPNGYIRFIYVGDYPFDTAFVDINYRWFSKGTPVFKSEFTPNTVSNYQPCNAIWHGKIQLVGDPYSPNKRTPTQVQKLLSGAVEYKGSFTKAISKIKETLPVKPVSFDEAVSILKKSTSVWKVGA